MRWLIDSVELIRQTGETFLPCWLRLRTVGLAPSADEIVVKLKTESSPSGRRQAEGMQSNALPYFIPPTPIREERAVRQLPDGVICASHYEDFGNSFLPPNTEAAWIP